MWGQRQFKKRFATTHKYQRSIVALILISKVTLTLFGLGECGYPATTICYSSVDASIEPAGSLGSKPNQALEVAQLF